MTKYLSGIKRTILKWIRIIYLGVEIDLKKKRQFTGKLVTSTDHFFSGEIDKITMIVSISFTSFIDIHLGLQLRTMCEFDFAGTT